MAQPSPDPNRRLVQLPPDCLDALRALNDEWRSRVIDAIQLIRESPQSPGGNSAMLYRLDGEDGAAAWFAEFEGDIRITYVVREDEAHGGDKVVLKEIDVGNSP